MDYQSIKRCIDLAGSVGLILLCIPAFLTISILIILIDKQSPIFQQKRPGLHGTPFWMYKFKTMRSHQDLTVELANVTKLGAVLRNYSFDELPQLINVFKGEMSLVGPRPLLMSYLPLYTKEQSARHNVKPGITGLAQVSGRNSLDWDTKFYFDLRYVKTLSFATDLKIILKTLTIIGKAQGVNASSTITVKPYSSSQTAIKC